MKFEIHTSQTAPEASQPTLAEVEKAYKFVPNLYGVLAESPLAVSAYLQLSGLIQAKSSLSPQEQQAVMLAVSFENMCEYCLAAHSTVAAMAKTPPATIQALRAETRPPDAKTAVLVAFARAVVQQRGWVTEESLNAFLAAGYSRAQVLDVIAIVALKTLSNYTNHLAHPPLEAPFAGQKWTRPPITQR